MTPPILRLTAADWEATVAAVGRCLNGGGIALLPAEGVYGLHVRADRASASARLASIKDAEARLGFIALIGRPEHWIDFVVDPPSRARLLVAAHWPGALTLVLPASPAGRRLNPRGLGTVALRCPGSSFLREVVRRGGGPLLSTSANHPGADAPGRVEDAWIRPADIVVDAGPLSGVPSTLARVDGDAVTILRAGAVALAEA